jgi:hypothetical protein
MSEEITQDIIDKGIAQAKAQWHKMVADSGLSQAVFIATKKEAAQFLGEYEMMRDQLKKQGWVLPQLIDGVKVNLS